RQETVAGMDSVHIGDFRGADNAVDPQITLACRRFANTNGLFGQLHVHRVDIRLRIDRDGPDIELLAGADDTNGNFPAVGDQDFFEHALRWPELKEGLAVFYWFGIFHQHLANG